MDRVGIIRDAAHHIARLVLAVVPERQPVNVPKTVTAHRAQDALSQYVITKNIAPVSTEVPTNSATINSTRRPSPANIIRPRRRRRPSRTNIPRPPCPGAAPAAAKSAWVAGVR